MQKAIFLDRDGVINVEKNYLYKIEDFEFVEGAFESLKTVQGKGYLLFIITNQSGIARGYYSLEDFEHLTAWMLEEFKNNGITISQVELCPHGPNDDCSCRKPKTGMIESILKSFDIDLENSWLVGDKSSDISCAINAGIKNRVQVRSGHDFDEENSQADFILNSIKELPTLIKS